MHGRHIKGAAAAAILILPTNAAAQNWPGQPPIGSDVTAAVDRARAGDPAALVQLSDSGRADAQFFLGTLHIFGLGGVAKDGVKGCALLEKASATRSDAMHVLGECFQYGYAGHRDLEKAMASFRKAAAMGLAKSRCAEGNVLVGLGRDLQRAVALCRAGAEAGDPDAQADLGNFYLLGQVVKKDVAEARRWYEKAAAQRHANAAFVLGQIYWNADGVPRDIARAKSLWRLAYDNGRTDAAFHIGDAAYLLSARGERRWDPTDLDEAARWYDEAVRVGPEGQRRNAMERAKLARELAGAMRRSR